MRKESPRRPLLFNPESSRTSYCAAAPSDHSCPLGLTILRMRIIFWPSLRGPPVIVIVSPTFKAVALQPELYQRDGGAPDSAIQSDTLPASSFTWKYRCGCGLTNLNSVTVPLSVISLSVSYWVAA